MAVQPSDGKLVVIGYGARDHASTCQSPPVNEFVVARLTTDGNEDESFGDENSFARTGWTSTAVTASTGRANAVAVQPDGKIVVAGQAGVPGPDSEFGLARYNSNGTLDTSFGSGCVGAAITPGTVTTDLPGTNESAAALALQPDGKIVLAGYTLTSTQNFDFALVRYDADGCPDSSFGPAHNGKVVYGQVTTNFSPRTGFAFQSTDIAQGVGIEPGGTIVAGGSA